MGRRKIEIQPITNERNRSVTFLKRKNGLFKKAHELGVLCSVDVAVIIFDERHGHDTKLFQYSSCDVRDIVQRHLRHNGERDTRGPSDFSGESSGGRNDATGDGDEDDDEGDADEAAASPKRTNPQIKDDNDSRPSARVIAEPETKHRGPYSSDRSASRSSITLSTFPPLSPYDTQHPMSSDRLNPAHERPYQDQPHNKKPRLDFALNLNMPRDHGPSEDSMHRIHEPIYMYPPHPSLRRSSDAAHPSHYPPYHLPYPSSPTSAHGPGPGPGYAPPPFHSPHSEFALNQQIPSWMRTHAGAPSTNGAAGLSALPALFGSSSDHLGTPTFDGLSFTRGDEGRQGAGPNEKNGQRDSFAHAFLEADQQQRKVSLHHPGGGLPVSSRGPPQSSTTTSAASFGIDWPSHRASSLPHPGAPPTPPSAPAGTAPASASASVKAKGEPAHEENGGAVTSTPDSAGAGWLELLSGTGPAEAAAAAANTLSAPAGTPVMRPRSSSTAPSTASASASGAAGS